MRKRPTNWKNNQKVIRGKPRNEKRSQEAEGRKPRCVKLDIKPGKVGNYIQIKNTGTVNLLKMIYNQ